MIKIWFFFLNGQLLWKQGGWVPVFFFLPSSAFQSTTHLHTIPNTILFFFLPGPFTRFLFSNQAIGFCTGFFALLCHPHPKLKNYFPNFCAFSIFSPLPQISCFGFSYDHRQKSFLRCIGFHPGLQNSREAIHCTLVGSS